MRSRARITRVAWLPTAAIAVAALAQPLAAGWPAALDLSGSAEYLLSCSSLRSTALNPGNALGLHEYGGYVEGRATLAAGMGYDSRAGLRIEPRYRFDYLNGDGELLIDQAYVNVRIVPVLSARVGRQRIGFGTGYVWSAVNDLDVARDVYSPDRYTQGVDAAKVTLDLAPVVKRPLSLSLEAVLPTGEDDPDGWDTKFGGQFYSLLGSVELGAAGSYRRRDRLADDALVGLFGSVDIAGFILGAEASVSRYAADTSVLLGRDASHFRPMVVVSLNRRVSKQSFAVLEYCYNGHGLSGEQLDTLVGRVRAVPELAPLAMARLVPGYTGRNYAFGAVSWEIAGRMALGLSALARLDRFGGFAYPQVSWTQVENLTVTLEGVFVFAGPDRSEFSLSPYDALGALRVQYFF